MLTLRCLLNIHREILEIQLDMRLELIGKVSARSIHFGTCYKLKEIIYGVVLEKKRVPETERWLILWLKKSGRRRGTSKGVVGGESEESVVP